jgi:cytochrome c-type biogenesis protein CcmH
MKIFIFLLSLFCSAALATATDIYEFKTPQQQKRFDNLTQQFRCLVCQNEALADSNAPLAQDLRTQIANLIQQGKSDTDITGYLTQRYGDFVLFRPPVQSTTYLLWFAPFTLLLCGFLLLTVLVKRRQNKS